MLVLFKKYKEIIPKKIEKILDKKKFLTKIWLRAVRKYVSIKKDK